ncbi:MAG: tetratricopeptide repeat protein [Roseiflexaceae bacterium]
MSPQALIVLLLVLILVALSATPLARDFTARQVRRVRQRVPARPPQRVSTGTTVIQANGDEVPVLAEVPPPRRAAGLDGREGRVVAAVVAAVLIAVLIGVQLYRVLTTPATGQFVVLVAPFQNSDGTIDQTGNEIATALVAELPQTSGGRVIARTLATPPANQADALAILSRENADALIWGQVTLGGMLDSQSLQPILAYQPSGSSAPISWPGYAGRFSLPNALPLASVPINGHVVLPGLLGALADYQNGHFDAAFNQLDNLIKDYPDLGSALPRALRGNMFWARGAYQEAANEYRRALERRPALDGQQVARLYTNLGAILQDAGDLSAAQAALGQASMALAGTDLSALRYNLGLQALRAGDVADAATQLEIARSPALLPPGTPTASLLLALGEAYRLGGAYPQAQAMLAEATREIPASASATTPDLRAVTSDQLAAEADEQRALLEMSSAAEARGPLLWELEAADPIPLNVLNSAESDLTRSSDETRVLVQGWTRVSTTKDASSEPLSGQIAISHAQQAQMQLSTRQRWLAAVQLERGEVTGERKPRGAVRFWSMLAGDQTPVGQGRELLLELLKAQPRDLDSMVLIGRSYVLSEDLESAGKYYNQAAAADPQRPEPVYGQAQVVLQKDSAHARQLLTKAIALNSTYFPARQQLAQIAESDDVRDWQTAIEQRMWLIKNRPSNAQTLKLAETLRRSGPDSYAAAEGQLLPLANRNNVDALLALSRLYQDMRNPQGARAAIERAQQAAPRNAEVAYQYGQFIEAQIVLQSADANYLAQQKQTDMDSAEAQYQRALTNVPGHVPSQLALGRLYAEQGKNADAKRYYNAALDAGASNPDQLKQIGQFLLDNGEYASAATAFERGITTTDRDAELHHGLATAYLHLERLDDAQREEQQALDLRGGQYPEALVGLGDIALERDDLGGAVAQYNSALQLNSNLTSAYLGVGRASFNAGNWSVAQAHFSDAVRSNPKSAEARFWLGESLRKQSNPNAAIAEYAHALALKANYPEAYYGLAQAQIDLKQFELARKNLDSALVLRPNYADALLLGGKLSEQQGNDTAAIQSYSAAISANDKIAEPLYRRALLFIRRDQLDEATRDLESAINIQPTFSEAHYWLGRAYLAQGNPKAAQAEFKLAIEQRGEPYAEASFYMGIAAEQLATAK